MAVIAGQDDALGARDILKQVDARFLQSAADQVLPDSGRRCEEKRSAQNQQQTVQGHTDFGGLFAFDIGELILHIIDDLIGRNGHFAIVKQGFGHRLDHQRLQAIKRLFQL